MTVFSPDLAEVMTNEAIDLLSMRQVHKVSCARHDLVSPYPPDWDEPIRFPVDAVDKTAQASAAEWVEPAGC